MTEVLTVENAERAIAGLKIRKASIVARGVFLCLYGQGGAGKTLLAGSMYRYGKTLHCDTEGGSESLQQWENEENLDIVDITSYPQFDKFCTRLKMDAAKPDFEYKTVVIDNLCEIVDLCEDDIDIKGNDSHDLQKYNLVKKEITAKIRLLRNLTRNYPINIIIVCWDDDIKDASSGILKKDLAFTPALRREFPGICTIIGHVKVLNTPEKRMLDFAPSNKSVAKFKRSLISSAMKVPYRVTYDVNHLPLVDVIKTIRGEGEWPKDYDVSNKEE